MSDGTLHVNNLELAQNTIDAAIQKSDMEHIPFCEAGVLTAVDNYIQEVKNQNGGNVTNSWITAFRNKYLCDCENCQLQN
ncbi:MAG: hypothetical protein Q8S84_08245 [bacterium]|nr:hypothetical protein [bacterium]